MTRDEMMLRLLDADGNPVSLLWLTTTKKAVEIGAIIKADNYNHRENTLVFLNKPDNRRYWIAGFIESASFEQGIKVDDEWWFINDIGVNELIGEFILLWDETDGSYYIELLHGGSRYNHAIAYLSESENLGRQEANGEKG